MKVKSILILKNGYSELWYTSLGDEPIQLRDVVGPHKLPSELTDELAKTYPGETIVDVDVSSNLEVSMRTDEKDFPLFIEKIWFRSMNTIFTK